MSCEMVEAALEGSAGEFWLMIFLLILFHMLAIYNSLKNVHK